MPRYRGVMRIDKRTTRELLDTCVTPFQFAATPTASELKSDDAIWAEPMLLKNPPK